MYSKDNDGKSGCGIIDVGVYTKNRNFRLFLSSKFGKNAVLKLHDEPGKSLYNLMISHSHFLVSIAQNIF